MHRPLALLHDRIFLDSFQLDHRRLLTCEMAFQEHFSDNEAARKSPSGI
jgi:hypothetical protein